MPYSPNLLIAAGAHNAHTAISMLTWLVVADDALVLYKAEARVAAADSIIRMQTMSQHVTQGGGSSIALPAAITSTMQSLTALCWCGMPCVTVPLQE